MKREFTFNIDHTWKLSDKGYFHFVLLAIAFGSDGLTLCILNIFITTGYVKKIK